MTAKYSPQKLLWATTAFFLLLFLLVFLIAIYGQQTSRDQQFNDTVSPLASETPSPTISGEENKYISNYDWRVGLPKEATVDKSIDRGSSSLERVTISLLDKEQPQKGFFGYSVDFSVEGKTTSLSTFADRDSLTNTTGQRQSFSVTTLGKKTGYKVLITGEQNFTSYYLPLKDDSKVLIVTTAINGPQAEEYTKKVSQILESLELLD